jgi:putative Ca2+/H+ antiporter (TMEM165/GDT1 family)
MNAVDLAALLATFLLVLPAELPDKTFVATLVLASRYPKFPVWLGVVAAFAVQCAIAVLAGGLLSLLPARLVSAAAAVLFAIGAVVMVRGGVRSRKEAELAAAELEQAEREAVIRAAGTSDGTIRPSGEITGAGDAGGDQPSAVGVAVLSVGVLFVAEWGDLSQFLTAAQAARTEAPLSVFLGASSALALVAGLATVAGGWLRTWVALHRVRFVSAGLLSVLAVIAASEAIRA